LAQWLALLPRNSSLALWKTLIHGWGTGPQALADLSQLDLSSHSSLDPGQRELKNRWRHGGTVVSTAASQLQGPGLGHCLCGVCTFSPFLSSVCSGFLPHSIDVRVRWIGHAKLPLSVKGDWQGKYVGLWVGIGPGWDCCRCRLDGPNGPPSAL